MLVNSTLDAGRHAATWDGTDAAGRGLKNGVYFYRMLAGERLSIRKMVMMK